MDKNKIRFGNIAEAAGKNAASLWNKTKESIVKAVDQNDDGSLDMKDVSAIAETIGSAAKNTAHAVKISAAEKLHEAAEKKREKEREALNPIFPEDLGHAGFAISKLIRITGIDKKYAESTVCNGAVGFLSSQKDFTLVNIFKGKADAFGLTFYPDEDSELYYVDPTDKNRYIALEDYFEYLKIARVNELQKLAQDLGATHFRVIYSEKKSSAARNTLKLKVSAKSVGMSDSADTEHSFAATETSIMEIAAENNFPGHAPHESKLCYLQKDPSIQSLITLRMDPTSPLSHQKYTLHLSNTSGIKESEAIKIDTALKAMKISATKSITSEVHNESNRTFEYEIDF